VNPMSKAANSAKTRWNATNYTQIKAYVPPNTAAAFKAACTATGVSMNSVLSQFIADYCDMQTGIKTKNDANLLSTNRKRRKRHEELLNHLIKLRDAQASTNDNVHENFRNTENFEAAQERVAMMDEAIEILESIY